MRMKFWGINELSVLINFASLIYYEPRIILSYSRRLQCMQIETRIARATETFYFNFVLPCIIV